MIIDKAITTYKAILAQMGEIERLLSTRNTEKLMATYQQMMDNQDIAKELDQHILDQLHQSGDVSNQARMLDLLDLMQQIQTANHRLTPQIRSIMAVQQNELRKLHQGGTMMRRYHSNTDSSGRLLSHCG